MTTDTLAAAAPTRSFRTWLLNPFHYVAGGQAFLIGVGVILATGLIGSLSRTHFDGVLDTHTGAASPLWVFAGEGLLDWLSMGIVLLLAGRLISKTRLRIVDVFGTQALARSPMLMASLFALLPGYQRFSTNLTVQFTGNGEAVQVGTADMVAFGVVIVVTIMATVWSVALMYRAFSISANATGGKAIGTFIVALLVAEVISKALVFQMIGVALHP